MLPCPTSSEVNPRLININMIPSQLLSEKHPINKLCYCTSSYHFPFPENQMENTASSFPTSGVILDNILVLEDGNFGNILSKLD